MNSVNTLSLVRSARAIFLLCTVVFPSVQAQVFDSLSGHETFHRFCASCHGENATGDGPVANAIPIEVPDLTTLKQRYGDEFDEHLLRKFIDGRSVVTYHGTRYMPVWGYEFWVEEGGDEAAAQRVETIITNLIDYISSIQQD